MWFNFRPSTTDVGYIRRSFEAHEDTMQVSVNLNVRPELLNVMGSSSMLISCVIVINLIRLEGLCSLLVIGACMKVASSEIG